MDWEKGLGKALVAIPLAHLITCGLYIAGYCAAFGGGVGMFFAPSDFFTVTLQHLILLYTSSLAMPLALITFRHRSGHPYAADAIAAEADESKKQRLANRNREIVIFVKISLYVITFVATALLFIQIYTHSDIAYYIILNTLTLSLSLIWWIIADKIRFYGLYSELTYVLICFMVSVIAQGLDAGEQDRRLPYREAYVDRTRCGNYVVLSSVGEHFIAVRADEDHQLIDKDCKATFTFPAVAAFPSAPAFTLLLQKIKPVPQPQQTPAAHTLLTRTNARRAPQSPASQ